MLSFENVQSFAQNVESILHFIILKKRCRVVYGYTNLFIYFSVLIFLCERYRKPYTTLHLFENCNRLQKMSSRLYIL